MKSRLELAEEVCVIAENLTCSDGGYYNLGETFDNIGHEELAKAIQAWRAVKGFTITKANCVVGEHGLCGHSYTGPAPIPPLCVMCSISPDAT